MTLLKLANLVTPFEFIVTAVGPGYITSASSFLEGVQSGGRVRDGIQSAGALLQGVQSGGVE